MQKRTMLDWHIIDLVVSFLVVVLLVWFTYMFLVKLPYAGFYFNPTNGQVVDIYVRTTPPNLLQVGDVIQQVADISWNNYKSDATQEFFKHIQKGNILEIAISRNGQLLVIPWPFPGFSSNEFKARLINIWWLGYVFWFFGFMTVLLIRPRNAQRRLVITANYLTAVWLVCGTLSGSHFAGSLITLRSTTWLLLPVYLNLHWYFPKPLFPISKAIWVTIYTIGVVLAFFEVLQLLPEYLYALGFLLALVGSLVLLLTHFVWKPTQRRDIGLLLMAILIAILPSAGLGILYTLGIVPNIGSVTLLFFPIMPLAYFFVIYRWQLGGLEVRANRLISMYSYLILLGTLLLLLVVPAVSLSTPPETLIVSTVIAALVIVYVSLLFFPRYQSFVEQYVLGIKLPYQGLLGTYSDRITTSTSLESLKSLLAGDVVPSLLVRQFVFLQFLRNQTQVVLARGVSDEQIPGNGSVGSLMTWAGKYIPDSQSNQSPLPWIRLILPLKIDGHLLGLWLLGQRDPDDTYSQAEIPLLQSLANQTAIALSNIHQSDYLTILYQENINRHEDERMSLALELHDGVLNQMAVLFLNHDPSTVSPKFNEAYEALTQQIREIVSNLRPPLLQYGLKPALEELTYKLTERCKDSVKMLTTIQGANVRYPENIELHIFRIVQQAAENALQHAHAKTIKITVILEEDRIDLTVDDDGVGFEIGDKIDLEDLLAQKHFGLAGIVERCRLIGADVMVKSSAQTGFWLHAEWRQKKDASSQ